MKRNENAWKAGRPRLSRVRDRRKLHNQGYNRYFPVTFSLDELEQGIRLGRRGICWSYCLNTGGLHWFASATFIFHFNVIDSSTTDWTRKKKKMPSRRTHLNTLGYEDELGHRGQDAGLVKHGVSDALQQGLHGSHAVHEKTSAQVAVVKEQEDEPRTHLARTGRMIQDKNIHRNTTETYSVLDRRIFMLIRHGWLAQDSCVFIPLPVPDNTNGHCPHPSIYSSTAGAFTAH